MTTKRAKETPETSDDETLVLEYLRSQYRPYAITDLILNLHNKVSKPLMVKTLNCLVQQQHIVCKNIGKLAYYVYKEKDMTEISGFKPELAGYKYRRESLEAIETKLMAIESETRGLESELRNLQAAPLFESLEQTANRLEETLAELNVSCISMESTAHLSNPPAATDAGASDLIQAHRNVLKQILRLRKNMFNRFVALIGEAINFNLVAQDMSIDLEELTQYSAI